MDLCENSTLSGHVVKWDGQYHIIMADFGDQVQLLDGTVIPYTDIEYWGEHEGMVM